MKLLIPLALAAMLLAMPAPISHFRAEIRADRAMPFRIALAYRVAIGARLGLTIRAGMSSSKDRPLHFTGNIALRP